MGRGDAAVSSRQKAKRSAIVCCMKRAVSLGTPTPQGKDAFRRATKHHGDPAGLTNAEGVASGSSESRDGASKSAKDTGMPPTRRRSPLGDVSNVNTTPDDTAAKLHRGWHGSFHDPPDEVPDMTPERELAERALSTAVGLRDLSNVLSPNPYASPGIVDGAHGECVNELDVVYGRYRAHKATRTPGFINSESRPEPATWYAKMETNDGDSSEVPSVAIPSRRSAVTLAHALGRWRAASSVSTVRSIAKRERDKLRAILREQADTCDAAVNAATAEIEDLMEALAESGSENSRLRWRWSARAGVLTERCDGYRREANRLRARAIGLETQLSGVEAHITNAATDFETLREKLNESRRETERARAGEDEARRQLVSAQAAAAEAIAAAARVASSPTAMNADVVKTAAREAAKKELKEELRAEIEAELRAEFEVFHRDTFADNNHARSGSVAKSVESVLHDGKSAQVRQLSAAKMEATARCSGNLAAMKAAGVETLKLDEDESHGGVESSELIALIAAHALQRCEAHPHGDGARAFYRAARRVELAAMACQPQYKKRGGRGS